MSTNRTTSTHTRGGPDHRGPATPLFKTAEEFQAFRQLEPRHHSRERWQLTDDHLREVVRVYRSGGRAGVVAVQEHFGRPRATASRWVVEARRHGFFDEIKTAPVKRPRKGTK